MDTAFEIAKWIGMMAVNICMARGVAAMTMRYRSWYGAVIVLLLSTLLYLIFFVA